MSDVWKWALLRKFPVLDLRWPNDVQAAWWREFWRLLKVLG